MVVPESMSEASRSKSGAVHSASSHNTHLGGGGAESAVIEDKQTLVHFYRLTLTRTDLNQIVPGMWTGHWWR